jgi:putative Mg2+ transporter-C (MgtC) family protein
LHLAANFRLNAFIVLAGNEQTVLRLGAALLLGSVLGLNRELHGKAAGLRTHALVCLGAAVAILLALGPLDRPTDANAVSRVVQGILTGVGFLGAGVILRDPMGHVTGLTTAATIWICAVLGIVCGLGYWWLLGIAVVITLLLLVFGRPIERLAEKLFHRHATQPPDHSV